MEPLATVNDDPAVEEARRQLARVQADLAALDAEVASLSATIAAQRDRERTLADRAEAYLAGETEPEALDGLQERLAKLRSRRDVLVTAAARARRSLEEAERGARARLGADALPRYQQAVAQLAAAVLAAAEAQARLDGLLAELQAAGGGVLPPLPGLGDVAFPGLAGFARPDSRVAAWIGRLVAAGALPEDAVPEPLAADWRPAWAARRRTLAPPELAVAQ